MSAFRGGLVSESFVRDELPALPGVTPPPPTFIRALERWWEATETSFGPASSVRALVDGAVIPLLRLLELDVTGRQGAGDAWVLETIVSGRRGPDVMVVAWGASLDAVWRTGVHRAIANDARWSFATNGTWLRVVDGAHAWTRDHLEIECAALHTEPVAGMAWTLFRGSAITASPSPLERAAEGSARYAGAVCRALGRGVLEAVGVLMQSLSARRPAGHDRADVVFEQSLTVLYRVLFLLFAEARALVPMAHPVYRDRYSLDAIVAALTSGASPRGTWQAVQAISRLAQNGCVAGDLRVNAFNGQLFGSVDQTWNRRPLPDAALAGAILSVATQPTTQPGPRAQPHGGGAPSRRPILYRDLDVEQLGSIYEQALEYEPAEGTAAGLRRSREGRKASGTFYTPRGMTDHVVRVALTPLVEGRTASEILSLKVLDPAMGSGAFLVAACRFLATCAEQALLQEGHWHQGDVTAADRTGLRRQIALRCLFGVDLNPMAVQLARLSVWLATLAADKPLSFLDHHLVAGNSLVGAAPADVLRRPSKVVGRRERARPLPLFDNDGLTPALEQAVRTRIGLALRNDDSAEIVRRKERDLAALANASTSLHRWRDVLDLWCAGWFWSPGTPPSPQLFGDVAGAILGSDSALQRKTVAEVLEQGRRIASRHGFVHWPLAFPEVFFDEAGQPLPNGGFDAVLGNPPWDMVRGDSGAEAVRATRRTDARQLADFARESGVYVVETRAHVNRYQLFVERALQLVRRGGRIGLVLPSGMANDAGTAPLRHYLFDRAEVDAITGFDNRSGIFPIHRGLRFALVWATRGAPTRTVSCRFGLTDVRELEAPAAGPLILSRTLLSRLSGDDDLGVPELGSETDLRICERIAACVPRLESPAGWHVRFGRELNASDDRDKLRAATGRPGARPVVEGKQIGPFTVQLDACRFELRPDARVPAHLAGRARLAYRDVASATNRLTLIAAVLPPHVVSTHTLFCLRTPLPDWQQHALCGLLNSFVANYLIRFRVNTHVTWSLVGRLPVPPVRVDDGRFIRLAHLASTLAQRTGGVEESKEYAELQAIAARLYGLTHEEFEHVLTTFPLVERAVREQAGEAYRKPWAIETGDNAT
jgi:hypothetical protein